MKTMPRKENKKVAKHKKKKNSAKESQVQSIDTTKLSLSKDTDGEAVPEEHNETSTVYANGVWNDFELKRPPLVTVDIKDMQFGKLDKDLVHSHVRPSNMLTTSVARLQKIVQPAIRKWFKNHDWRNIKFSETASLLARLIARRKNSFRHMAGFQGLCKINAALRRLLRVDLRREVERFDGALPDGIYAGVEVPTGNCCEFVLARVLAVYYIHVRIRDLCVVTAEYFVRLMRPNYFLEINILFLGVLAKLYHFSGILGNDCVELYGILRSHKDQFPYNTRNRVLPVEFVLPAQLDVFNDKPMQQNVTQTEDESNMNSLINTPQPIIFTKKPKKQDMGVAIERKQATKPVFSLDQLQTVEQVVAFFKTETKERESVPKTCVTKNLQQHEWLGLQKMFHRKLDAKEHKKALNIVLKFLSSKL